MESILIVMDFKCKLRVASKYGVYNCLIFNGNAPANRYLKGLKYPGLIFF